MGTTISQGIYLMLHGTTIHLDMTYWTIVVFASNQQLTMNHNMIRSLDY